MDYRQIIESQTPARIPGTFGSLAIGTVFEDASRGRGHAFAVVGRPEGPITEGFVSPMLRLPVSRLVLGEDRTLSSFGRFQYLAQAAPMHAGESHTVQVRTDMRFQVWTGPAPVRTDFEPYADDLADCCCELCRERWYAVCSGAADGGSDGRRTRIASRILLDALAAGEHVRVEEVDWHAQVKADRDRRVADGGEPRGYGRGRTVDFLDFSQDHGGPAQAAIHKARLADQRDHRRTT